VREAGNYGSAGGKVCKTKREKNETIVQQEIRTA